MKGRRNEKGEGRGFSRDDDGLMTVEEKGVCVCICRAGKVTRSWRFLSVFAAKLQKNRREGRWYLNDKG